MFLKMELSFLFLTLNEFESNTNSEFFIFFLGKISINCFKQTLKYFKDEFGMFWMKGSLYENPWTNITNLVALLIVFEGFF